MENLLSEFNKKCSDRLSKGKEKYGDDAYLKRDLVEDIEEELLDVANYAFLFFCKVRRLRGQIK